jgi:predicted transglutaminase-like cysteine proteinase
MMSSKKIFEPGQAPLRKFGQLSLLAIAALSLSACGSVTTGSAMRDGGLTMPPAGWLDFCGRNAGDPSCQVVEMNPAHMKELQSVQQSVRTIAQVEDRKVYGRTEFWQVAKKSGDCEDIALAARERLLNAGWPPSAVRLATAWTETGDYHTVLTVDGQRDGNPTTYVLDNRFAQVVTWQRLEQIGYRFHIRQAKRGPTWVTIQS